MTVRFVGTNVGVHSVQPLSEIVSNLLDLNPQWLKVASAFYSQETLQLSAAFVEAGARLELLLGTSGGNVTKDLLVATRRFAERPEVAVHFGFAPGGIFHPKMLLAQTQHGVLGVVGSSNFTQGGLVNNLELGVVMEGTLEPPTGLLGQLNAIFDELMSRSTPLEAAFNDLYEAASERVPPLPPDPARVSESLSSTTREDVPDEVPPVSEPVRTLLIELSPADVTRKPWGDAVGTNQLNLPGVLPDLIPWIPWPAPPPAQNALRLPGRFVGTGALRGQVATTEFGIWQRRVRDWGALESPRFTFYRDLANLVADDIGQPAVGAVLVLGFSTGEFHDVMVLQPDTAEDLELVPDPASPLGGPRDYEGLSWEVRNNVDWEGIVTAL